MTRNVELNKSKAPKLGFSALRSVITGYPSIPLEKWQRQFFVTQIFQNFIQYTYDFLW